MDTFWVQKEFIVNNVHLRVGFCEIWHMCGFNSEKYEKYGKNTFFFNKNLKLTKNY